MTKYAAIFFISLMFFGCATTDAIDPSEVKIAQLRSSTRELEDKISTLNQTQEDLLSQIEQIKQENMQLQADVQDNWSNLKSALLSLKKNQKLGIDKTVKNAMASSIKDQERLNAKLAKVVKAIQSQNASLQQKVLEDLSVNQQEVKSMRVQLNACMDKIERMEKQIKILNSASYSRASAGAKKTSSSSRKSSGWSKTKNPIKRTSKPTSSKIDYNQGYEHIVAPGETLWKIARDFKISVQDILNTNPEINDTTMLRPGQKLFIPLRKE